MSPWGHPDTREEFWCVACGALGSEWVERATWPGQPPPPTKRVRLCPLCAQAGWTLTGPKEIGVFFLRQRPRGAPRIDEPEPTAITPFPPPRSGQGEAPDLRSEGKSGLSQSSRAFAEDDA